jgi:sterol desaturase/sphingolipid hydroxylase (fatty acid hydroxylase superfamily)
VSDKVRPRERVKREQLKEVTVTAEVLDKFAELITVALGLVAALAWNTAIQNLFTMFFGKAGSALIGQFVYALLITLVVIFATIAVSRAAERAKKREEERSRGLFGR